MSNKDLRRLVVAPHADDEVLGCGGLLAKYPDTAVVLVTQPDDQRHREMLAARHALGCRGALVMIGLPDGEVYREQHALVGRFDQVMRALKPEEVYLPYPGTHQDHVSTFEAGMRACRQSLNPDHWMPPTVLVYETPTYDLALQEYGLRYSVFESLTAEHVAAKQKAMSEYESQVVKPHAGSPDELAARARSLGLARNLEFAEQFAPVRMVR